MKVKQMKISLELNPGKRGEQTVVFINYDNVDKRGYGDSEKNRFYVLLPQVVADALGVKETRGSTQEDAYKNFLEAIEKFKKIKTEQNRVILYEISINPDPAQERRYPGYHGYGGAGYDARVWARTYEETVCIDGTGGKRYSYEPVESPVKYPGEPPHKLDSHEGKKFEAQVPWTGPNEKFFVCIGEHLNGLITRLDEIRSPDKMIEAINSGRLLPLGSSQQNK